MNIMNGMKRCSIGFKRVWLLLGLMLIALPLAAETALYLTYIGGNEIDTIDPGTRKVVPKIKLAGAHGIGFSPDGRRIYVSDESEKVLVVLDQASGAIIKKVPLSGTPNLLAVSRDGRRVFVGIREAPGALDVIDTSSLERVKSIPMKGGLHDIYLTPDGNYVFGGSPEGKLLTVVDVRTEETVWEVKFESAVLTCAADANPDGSTRRIFVNRRTLHGFDVVDFGERKIVAEIKLPDEDSGGKIPHSNSPCHGKDLVPYPCHDTTSLSHGMGVTPDNKTLWVDSLLDDAVFVFSLPDLKLLGHVQTGLEPNWMSFSPDSKKAYICDRNSNEVSVIDRKTLKEVARIPVEQHPYKIFTGPL